jgi:hypothetical protein
MRRWVLPLDLLWECVAGDHEETREDHCHADEEERHACRHAAPPGDGGQERAGGERRTPPDERCRHPAPRRVNQLWKQTHSGGAGDERRDRERERSQRRVRRGTSQEIECDPDDVQPEPDRAVRRPFFYQIAGNRLCAVRRRNQGKQSFDNAVTHAHLASD